MLTAYDRKNRKDNDKEVVALLFDLPSLSLNSVCCCY